MKINRLSFVRRFAGFSLVMALPATTLAANTWTGAASGTKAMSIQITNSNNYCPIVFS